MILGFLNKTLYRSKQYIVKQNWRHRSLIQPDGVTHSRINRHAFYKPSLEYLAPMIQLCNVESGDYLMLGLGGGALLHALDHKLKNPHFDVVEINPEIINIAKQFFYVDTIKSAIIYEDDAQHYVSQCHTCYDAVLIDIYQDKAYPKHCATESFFQYCKNLISENGVIAINCANMSQYPMLLNQLRSVFNQSVITVRVSHPRNVIMLASKQPVQTLLDKISLKKLGWHTDTGIVGYFK